MKLPKIKKLNAKGVSHHVLIAVLVIAGIAGFGGWRVYSSNAATPASMCGAGYVQTHSQYAAYWDGRWVYGPATLYIAANTSTKKVCAVLMSTGRAYGVVKPMSLSASITNNSGSVNRRASPYPESGDFKYYAGPVRVSYYGLDPSKVSLKLNSYINYQGKRYNANISDAYALSSYLK